MGSVYGVSGPLKVIGTLHIPLAYDPIPRILETPSIAPIDIPSLQPDDPRRYDIMYFANKITKL